jgi:hypothetical protein
MFGDAWDMTSWVQFNHGLAISVKHIGLGLNRMIVSSSHLDQTYYAHVPKK